MRVSRHWRNKLFRYRLVGWRCVSCGAFHYFKPLVCKRCGSREFREVELPKTGKLLAYTMVKIAPKDFKDKAPYLVGLVELDDGTKILGQLTDFTKEELKEGARVEAVLRKIREDGESGIIEYGFKFRPEIRHPP